MEEEKARTPAVRCRQRRAAELNMVVLWLGSACCGVVFAFGLRWVDQHDGEWGGWQGEVGSSQPLILSLVSLQDSASHKHHYTRSHARENNDKDAAEAGAFPPR